MKTSTRDRLLTAAQAVFLEHGFEETTVQMIADAADANIAAVNYHYGSKADLYTECIANYLEDSVSRMPMLEDHPDAPEEQFKEFVRWFFTRYRQDSLLRHLNRDMGNLKPTFLHKIVETVVRPEFENCTKLVAALLPRQATGSTVRAHVMNIIAMCIAPMHGSQLYEHLYPEVPFDDREIKRQCDQAIRLILGGLKSESERLNFDGAEKPTIA